MNQQFKLRSFACGFDILFLMEYFVKGSLTNWATVILHDETDKTLFKIQFNKNVSSSLLQVSSSLYFAPKKIVFSLKFVVLDPNFNTLQGQK